MSKRQRFFVESIQDQITVISWKKLVADAERIATSETAAPSNIFHANSKTVPGSHLGLHQATVPENSNTTESNPLVSIETAGTLNKKPRGKLKLAVSNSTKTITAKPAEVLVGRKPAVDRSMLNSTSRQIQPKPNVKRIMEAKTEFSDNSLVMESTVPKGKVHRSLPIASGKTSCRAKKKTKACFCCSKKDPRTTT